MSSWTLAFSFGATIKAQPNASNANDFYHRYIINSVFFSLEQRNTYLFLEDAKKAKKCLRQLARHEWARSLVGRTVAVLSEVTYPSS